MARGLGPRDEWRNGWLSGSSNTARSLTTKRLSSAPSERPVKLTSTSGSVSMVSFESGSAVSTESGRRRSSSMTPGTRLSGLGSRRGSLSKGPGYATSRIRCVRRVISPTDQELVAIHEAGHAVAAVFLGREISVVSVINRSDSAGRLFFSGIEGARFAAQERWFLETTAMTRLAGPLAGPLAER